jgi:lipoprotein-anchoring transpeptidase ErfK/SrfK
LAASEQATFLTKMRMRLLGEDFDHVQGVQVRYPRREAKAFVAGLAEELNRDPRDASIDYSTGWVDLVREQEGRKVLTKKSHRALMGALRGDDPRVDLKVKTIAPTVTADSFDQILLLHIGENRLFLYNDGKITHSWTVATGQPEYPTPTGLYEVTEKRYMPTWVNPDPEGWGASMPASIGPGPGNPLGTRALNWSASGIRFHGTEATYSLGYNASHGCVRMAMADVEALYDMIEVGTPIVSVSYGSYDPLYDSAQNN